jgi:hypothetical protein
VSLVTLREPPIDENIVEQAVWALGNIAGDGPVLRDMVLATGFMTPLLTIICSCLRNPSRRSILRNAAWTLSNLCRGRPPPPPERVRPSLPVICELLRQDDEEAITDSSWALSYITDNGGGITVEEAIHCAQAFIPRLRHDSVTVVVPTLRTLGNIVTSPDNAVTQACIDCGCLPPLHSLLRSQKTPILKETCWVISNITAGTISQIQAVLDAGIIETLLPLLHCEKAEVRKEAVWAVANAAITGNTKQCGELIRLGTTTHMFSMLQMGHPDPRALVVVLEAIQSILRQARTLGDLVFAGVLSELEKCHGLRLLESLQNHLSQDVFSKV